MRKSKTRAEAARKADRWFSVYIRVRDADSRGNVRCITCGKEMHWRKAHAGHFVTRAHWATRYEETNAHAQCAGCNTYRSGEQYQHGRKVDEIHGEGHADFLIARGAQLAKFRAEDLDAIAASMERNARDIAHRKGIAL